MIFSTNRFKLLSISLLVLVFMFSMGAVFALGAGHGEEAKISMWTWRPEDDDEYQEILEVFESRNPNINVELRSIKNTRYLSTLATALEGKKGPDVMQLKPYGQLQRYTNYLMPLGDKVPKLDNFPSDALEASKGREDGKIYGVPFARQITGIYYNKGIFEEYGLSEPSTWEEFIEVCEVLKDNGEVPLANAGKAGWMLEMVFSTVGPNFFGGDQFFQEVTAGETTFEDPRFVEALKRVKDLKKYMQPGMMGVGYTSQQASFYTGQAAMFIGGSFEAAFFQERGSIDIGVFPAPAPADADPRYVTTYQDGSYGVNSRSEHPEAALELIKFMATKDFGKMFTNKLGQISSVPGVQADPDKVPILSQFIDMANKYESTPYIMMVGFRWEKPTGSQVLQNTLQGLMSGQLTPEEVAEEIQSTVASWHEPFQD